VMNRLNSAVFLTALFACTWGQYETTFLAPRALRQGEGE
jgi:hypothetical protein